MSTDLASGIFLITGLSVLAYVAGVRIGSASAKLRPLLLVASLIVAVSFSWVAAGKLAWAWWIPSASILFWSNLTPALMSLTAGLISTSPSSHRYSRPVALAFLILLTVGHTLTPVLRPIVGPAHTDAISTWRDEVCLQSHSATCAPAAAVTLLKTAGIKRSETNLVSACLSSTYGTEPLGLFRGLAIASRGCVMRPAVASSDPSNWIEGDQLPNVALVRFDMSESAGAPAWLLGQKSEGHAVVILGRDPRGNWIIADPAFGRTLWSESTFRDRFTGDAIYMAKR